MASRGQEDNGKDEEDVARPSEAGRQVLNQRKSSRRRRVRQVYVPASQSSTHIRLTRAERDVIEGKAGRSEDSDGYNSESEGSESSEAHGRGTRGEWGSGMNQTKKPRRRLGIPRVQGGERKLKA